MDALVTIEQVRFGLEPGAEPALDPVGGQQPNAALPQVRGQVGGEQQLVLGQDVMLAPVALQPTPDHAPVEGDAVDGPAGESVLLDLRNELGDQTQGVGALGQLGEVVDRVDGFQDALDLGVDLRACRANAVREQRRSEIAAHLLRGQG